MSDSEVRSFCEDTWPEWALVCELEAEHAGAHLSYSGKGGKIGAWGLGRPGFWRRA